MQTYFKTQQEAEAAAQQAIKRMQQPAQRSELSGQRKSTAAGMWGPGAWHGRCLKAGEGSEVRRFKFQQAPTM